MILPQEELKTLLLDYGLLTQSQIKKVEEMAKLSSTDFDRILVQENFLSDPNLGQLVADYYHYDFVSLRNVNIPEETLKIIPERVARNQRIIAFEESPSHIKLAMQDPSRIDLIHIVEKKTGKEVKAFFATSNDIENGLVLYQRNIQERFDELMKDYLSQAEKTVKRGEELDEFPIIQIVDLLLKSAYQRNASDIHLEPRLRNVIVRFRVDGILKDILTVSKEVNDLMVTRIKIMSKLRTDEHLSAQDGKLRIELDDGSRADVRVSIVPITEGEKVVMRLLAEKARQYSLEDLGLANDQMELLREAITRPHGMILATGPTGSGKTTTLYAIIQLINSREINISTIEDPVEYDVDGVNQIQVNARTNLTFAKGLRSILRQDPDVIMIGEIRDEDTANISINAAMTGHLVLSTLHTNDAPTTLPRLREMKVEPFLIASSINIAIAQRLVRKICKACIESYRVTGKELADIKKDINVDKLLGKKVKSLTLYRGKGCPACGDLGYRGRTGVFELMEMSEEIRRLVMKGANADEIRVQAVKEGMKTMLQDGLDKVLSGETTIEEILRVAIE